jgi:hypothetical protein
MVSASTLSMNALIQWVPKFLCKYISALAIWSKKEQKQINSGKKVNVNSQHDKSIAFPKEQNRRQLFSPGLERHAPS